MGRNAKKNPSLSIANNLINQFTNWPAVCKAGGLRGLFPELGVAQLTGKMVKFVSKPTGCNPWA
jgi:hypothetical protein